jgi:hypothetical protein
MSMRACIQFGPVVTSDVLKRAAEGSIDPERTYYQRGSLYMLPNKETPVCVDHDLDRRGDLYAVKELLGHSSTRVTEVYLHSSRTRTESAVQALTEYRRGNRQTEER